MLNAITSLTNSVAALTAKGPGVSGKVHVSHRVVTPAKRRRSRHDEEDDDDDEDKEEEDEDEEDEDDDDNDEDIKV